LGYLFIAALAYPLSVGVRGCNPRREIPGKILRLKAARLIITPSSIFSPGAPSKIEDFLNSLRSPPEMKIGPGRQNK
jgi:hypothetical protein